MSVSDRKPIPTALLVLVAAVLVALLVLSAITGQWAILVLGAVAIGALAVPFRNR
jgi:hypothetical protein